MSKLTWKISDGGMGGFLCPAWNAQHFYHVTYGKRISMSLECAVNDTHVSEDIRVMCAKMLENPGVLTEEWVKKVYWYFQTCYSPDGINRNASECIVDRSNSQPAENHLAYLHIRQYFPNYQVRLDLI